ncbi:MAG: G5 domain-containing protein, partial [Streptococcus mitis]|nr:G5 domain-containing protein [Streptococcus mitis]
AKPDGYIQNYLRDDSVGTTDYVYGAKYREGRFTNNAPESDRLEHSGTVSHTVFDVGANTTRVMVKSGTSLADSQAKDAVMAVNGSEPLPKGTTYEWVNQDGTPLANKQVTEKGEAVRYVKVTLPKTAEDGPVATQYRSSKIVRVIINESEKPRVSFNGSELSTDASNENSKFVIFRGATFDPTFTVSDNSGKVTEIKASGLPSGREFVKNTDTPNGNVQITGNDITATSNATLGDHIGKVLVKDALGNEQEYQFKYTVVDIKIVENPKTVPINTKLGDSHFHVRLVNSDATDATSQEGLYPTNTKFKWKKENNGVSNETVLSEPGKITGYKAVVESPAARAGFYTKNGVKIYMPASIERDITFLVKPNDIIRYSKNGDDVDKTTTTHTVDPNTGKITPTPNTVTHQKDGAKDTVVTQTIPVTTRYEPDETKDVGINTVVNNGSEGSIVTTTPKLVNEITGEVTNGTPVVRKTEMVPKVVKVGTKPKVVETPLEKPVRYVADPTQPKGEKTTETEGEDGKVVTTTHYTVNPDGSVTEGETTSVRIEPKEKVVKVGTKEAKLTPTVELDQDPDTGEVTVTPKKPDGTLYPENTK